MEIRASEITGAALAYLVGAVGDLIKVSILPGILLLGIALLAGYANAQDIMSMVEAQGGGAPVASMSADRLMTLGGLGLAQLVATSWLVVRICRLRLFGQQASGSDGVGEMASTIRFILYSLLVLLMVALPFAFVGAFTSLLNDGTGGMSGGEIAGFLLMSAALVGGLYAWVRLWAGMPAVAIGQKPHILRDMWPFAEKIGWGLLAQLMLLTLGILFLLGIVTWVLGTLLIGTGTLDTAVLTDRIKDDPAGFVSGYMTLQGLATLIGLPGNWLYGLFFSEAFARLSGRTTPRPPSPSLS